MPAMSERKVWAIRVMIEATDEQAAGALEAIERALCPDENHPGYCPVPWTLISSRFGDLEPEERATWQSSFEEDRDRARDVGETDA